MKQYGIFKCGHKGYFNITRQNRWKYDTDEKIQEYLNDHVCDECFEKARQEKIKEERKEVKEVEKQVNLIDLEGSQKQIDWANTIRIKLIRETKKMFKNEYHTIKFFDEVERRLKYLIEEKNNEEYEKINKIFVECDNFEEKKKIAIEAFDNLFDTKSSASEYIDMRDKGSKFVAAFIDSLININDDCKGIAEELEEEYIVRVEKPKNAKLIEISSFADVVTIKSIPNQELKEIIKENGFRWDNIDNVWTKKVIVEINDIEDVMAEVSNDILASSFEMKIVNSSVREKAKTGSFKREHKRIIDIFNKELVLFFEKGNTIYEETRDIKGSKWNKDIQGVTVPLRKHLEVEDVANKYGFVYTKKALDTLEDFKNTISSEITEIEQKIEQKVYENKVSESNVLESLKDDE